MCVNKHAGRWVTGLTWISCRLCSLVNKVQLENWIWICISYLFITIIISVCVFYERGRRQGIEISIGPFIVLVDFAFMLFSLFTPILDLPALYKSCLQIIFSLYVRLYYVPGRWRDIERIQIKWKIGVLIRSSFRVTSGVSSPNIAFFSYR